MHLEEKGIEQNLLTDINVSTKVQSESRTTTKSVKATSNRGKGKRKGDKKTDQIAKCTRTVSGT